MRTRRYQTVSREGDATVLPQIEIIPLFSSEARTQHHGAGLSFPGCSFPSLDLQHRWGDVEQLEANLSTDKAHIWKQACLGCSQQYLLVRIVNILSTCQAWETSTPGDGEFKNYHSSFQPSHGRFKLWGPLLRETELLKTYCMAVFPPNRYVSMM